MSSSGIIKRCPRCDRSFGDLDEACPDHGPILVAEPSNVFDPELRRGEKVAEYVVEARIGSGTFGVVYRGVQPIIAKQVAIKVLGRKYSSDPQIVSRFIAEARAVNQIRHRNIIDIFAFGQLPDGRHYHIMELLSGQTLQDVLLAQGRLPILNLLEVLRPLARALDAAHVAGIAHRDLKPANVFISVGENGAPDPKLLDFGVAKLMTDDLPREHRTGTGMAIGTPDYMAPEQCQGANIDHRADIYAFGVMTHQLLTGQLPFQAPSVVQLLMKHIQEPPPRASVLCPEVPPSFDPVIAWMMEKDPDARPTSLREAMLGLERAARAGGFDVPETGDLRPSASGSRGAARPGASEARSGAERHPGASEARSVAERHGVGSAEFTSAGYPGSPLSEPGPSTLPIEARGDVLRPKRRRAGGVAAVAAVALVAALLALARARSDAPSTSPLSDAPPRGEPATLATEPSVTTPRRAPARPSEASGVRPSAATPATAAVSPAVEGALPKKSAAQRDRRSRRAKKRGPGLDDLDPY